MNAYKKKGKREIVTGEDGKQVEKITTQKVDVL